jgi:hypothetical protein
MGALPDINGGSITGWPEKSLKRGAAFEICELFGFLESMAEFSPKAGVEARRTSHFLSCRHK